MHLAGSNGFRDVVELLLKHDANGLLRNCEGGSIAIASILSILIADLTLCAAKGHTAEELLSVTEAEEMLDALDTS